ncbi:MAG: glycosyltransferase family 2 protein [Balneolaceae bacterium]
MSVNTYENSPLVYIIILNWNNYEDSYRCIESVQKVNYANYKIVLVDNASTDSSCHKLKLDFPEVLIIENEINLGYSGGNNKGIELALVEKAQFIWVLNNDTTVSKNTLKELLSTMKKDKDSGIAGCKILNTEPLNEVQVYGGGRVNYFLGTQKSLTKKSLGLNYISGTSLFMKSEVVGKVGKLDEDFFMYWEDVEFSHRVKANNYNLTVASSAIIYHKNQGTFGQGNNIFFEYLYAKGAILFFRKQVAWWPISITILITGKIIKKVFTGQWKVLPDILRGIGEGLNQRISSY